MAFISDKEYSYLSQVNVEFQTFEAVKDPMKKKAS
jgi:hypothetical protein